MIGASPPPKIAARLHRRCAKSRCAENRAAPLRLQRGRTLGPPRPPYSNGAGSLSAANFGLSGSDRLRFARKRSVEPIKNRGKETKLHWSSEEIGRASCRERV